MSMVYLPDFLISLTVYDHTDIIYELSSNRDECGARCVQQYGCRLSVECPDVVQIDNIAFVASHEECR